LDEQRRKFIGAGYPSQVDANRIDKESWQSKFGEELIGRLEREIGRSVPVVFEENQAEVKRLVAVVRDAVDLQRKRQLEHLASLRLPEGAVSVEAAAFSMGDTMRAWLQAERGTARGRPVYDLVPSVKAKLQETAEQAEMDRFVRFLRDFAPVVRADPIRAALNTDPGAHKDRAKSQERVARALLADAGGDAVQQYTAKPVPHTEMATFRNRLKTYLRKGPAEEALWSTVSAQVATVLDGVRTDFAQGQFSRHFGPLAMRTWAVPEKELKAVVEGRLGMATFEESMTLPDITSGERPPRAQLLVETENFVVGGVGKLVEEGKRAWNGQLDIVKRRADTFERMMQDAADKKQLGSKEEWIEKYTDAVQGDWVAARPAVIWRSGEVAPANAASKYSPLFGEVRREINKTVSALFDSTEKRAALSSKTIEQRREPVAITTPATPGRESGTTQLSLPPGGKDGETGRGKQGGGHPGQGGAAPHPSLGGEWVRFPWWWLLLALLVIVLAVMALLGVRWWRRRRPERRLREFLGPFDARLENGSLTFYCRDKPEVWRLVRD
jgi:hypothetical protein